jgi:hypothetical protein
MHLDFLGIIYEKVSCVKYYSIIFLFYISWGWWGENYGIRVRCYGGGWLGKDI